MNWIANKTFRASAYEVPGCILTMCRGMAWFIDAFIDISAGTIFEHVTLLTNADRLMTIDATCSTATADVIAGIWKLI